MSKCWRLLLLLLLLVALLVVNTARAETGPLAWDELDTQEQHTLKSFREQWAGLPAERRAFKQRQRNHLH